MKETGLAEESCSAPHVVTEIRTGDMVLWSNTDYVTVLLDWGFSLKSQGVKLIPGIYTYMIM